MSAPDQPHDDRTTPDDPIVGEHLSSSEVARLNEALKALPTEIADSLRSAPIGVHEVRSRWKKWLAAAAVVVAVASGIFTLVSNLTAPTVASQVAPISRTAHRVDRGITGVESAIDRVRTRYEAVRDQVAPEQPRDPADPDRREFRIGKDFGLTLDRDTDPAAGPDGGVLGGWRFRLGPRQEQ